MFNSDKNPVSRLFSSPVLIRRREITRKKLQMWPQSDDSYIICVRIIPFSWKWHISADSPHVVKPSLCLSYKWKCCSTVRFWPIVCTYAHIQVRHSQTRSNSQWKGFMLLKRFQARSHLCFHLSPRVGCSFVLPQSKLIRSWSIIANN